MGKVITYKKIMHTFFARHFIRPTASTERVVTSPKNQLVWKRREQGLSDMQRKRWTKREEEGKGKKLNIACI